jgi:hypothetical protein
MERHSYFPEADENIRKSAEEAEKAKAKDKKEKERIKNKELKEKRQKKEEKQKGKDLNEAYKENGARDRADQKEKERLEKAKLEAQAKTQEKEKAEALKAEKAKERTEQEKHIKDGFISLFGKDGYHPDKNSAAPDSAKAGAPAEQEPTINPKGPEAAKEISNAIEQTLKQSGENLPKQIQAANPEVSSAQAQAIAEHLNQPDVKKSLGQRIKDKISDIYHGIKDRPGALTGGAAAGFGATMLSRSLLRNGIRFLLGGSFGAGILAGAGAGGTIEGVRKIYREKHKVSADDILTQLTDTGKSDVERAILISKAQKALSEARINDKSKVPELKAKIQEAQTALVVKMNKAEFAGKPERDQIAFILKTSALERKNLNKDQKKEVKELMDQLKIKAEGKVDWKEVAKAAGKGALVGAVGGAIGGAVAGVISDFMHPDLAHDAIQHHIEALGGLRQETYNSVIKQGAHNAIDGNYTETAQHGEGLTHLARKGVHDWLTNAHKLDPAGAPNLTPEQMVYAEDYILKNDLLNHGASSLLYPGDHITLTGGQIMEAIGHANGLNQVQLDSLHNLLNTPDHLLSAHTRELMMNFDQFADAQANDYADPLMAGARAAAEQVSPEMLTWFNSPSTELAHKYAWWLAAGGVAALGVGEYAANKKRKNEEQKKVTPAPEAATAPADPNAAPIVPGTTQAEKTLSDKEKADIKAIVEKLDFVPRKKLDQDDKFRTKGLINIVEFWKQNFDDNKFNKLIDKLKGYKISLAYSKTGNDKYVGIDTNDNSTLNIAGLYYGDQDEIAEQLTTILGVLDDKEMDEFKKAIAERKAKEAKNNPTTTPSSGTAAKAGGTGTTPAKTISSTTVQNTSTKPTVAGAQPQNPATAVNNPANTISVNTLSNVKTPEQIEKEKIEQISNSLKFEKGTVSPEQKQNFRKNVASTLEFLKNNLTEDKFNNIVSSLSKLPIRVTKNSGLPNQPLEQKAYFTNKKQEAIAIMEGLSLEDTVLGLMSLLDTTPEKTTGIEKITRALEAKRIAAQTKNNVTSTTATSQGPIPTAITNPANTVPGSTQPGANVNTLNSNSVNISRDYHDFYEHLQNELSKNPGITAATKKIIVDSLNKAIDDLKQNPGNALTPDKIDLLNKTIIKISVEDKGSTNPIGIKTVTSMGNGQGIHISVGNKATDTFLRQGLKEAIIT